jgi:hypothetical protein
LDSFNQQKRRLRLGKENKFFCALDSYTTTTIHPNQIDKLFEDALQGPFDLARLRIQHFAELKADDKKVIVTGGTARHEAVKARLAMLCSRFGLDEPLFPSNIDGPMEYVTF